jgi:hypothetical protein
MDGLWFQGWGPRGLGDVTLIEGLREVLKVGVRTGPGLYYGVGDGGYESKDWTAGSFIDIPVSVPNPAAVSIRKDVERWKNTISIDAGSATHYQPISQ